MLRSRCIRKSLSDAYGLFKVVPDIVVYFPDYKANQMPNRRFMLKISSTSNIAEIIKMVQIASKNKSA